VPKHIGIPTKVCLKFHAVRARTIIALRKLKALGERPKMNQIAANSLHFGLLVKKRANENLRRPPSWPLIPSRHESQSKLCLNVCRFNKSTAPVINTSRYLVTTTASWGESGRTIASASVGRPSSVATQQTCYGATERGRRQARASLKVSHFGVRQR